MNFFQKLFRHTKVKYVVEVNHSYVAIDTVKVPNAVIVISGYIGKDGSYIKIHKL